MNWLWSNRRRIIYAGSLLSILAGASYAGHGGERTEYYSGDEVPLTYGVSDVSAPTMINADGSDANNVQSLPVVGKPHAGKRSGAKEGSAGKDDRGAGEGKNTNVALVAPKIYFPLFVIVDSPIPKDENSEPKFEVASDSIADIIRMKVPGAKIVRLPSTDPGAIATAWTDLKSKEKLTSIPASTTVVINTKAKLSLAGDLYFLFGDTYSSQTLVAQSARRLYETVLISAKEKGDEKTELSTVLLTSFAGNVECRNFPGPIFGITPASVEREGRTVDFWINYHLTKNSAPFPTTAREWYLDWGVTNKISGGRFFRCPAENRRGYEGTKAVEASLR